MCRSDVFNDKYPGHNIHAPWDEVQLLTGRVGGEPFPPFYWIQISNIVGGAVLSAAAEGTDFAPALEPLDITRARKVPTPERMCMYSPPLLGP